MTLGFRGFAVTPLTRPLMLAGPMERQRIWARKAESARIRWARRGAGRRAASPRMVRKRRIVRPRTVMTGAAGVPLTAGEETARRARRQAAAEAPAPRRAA